MLKIDIHYQHIKLGFWKQCVEIVHEGRLLGFVDRETSPECEVVRTRNVFGETVEGERLEWLLQQAA